MDDEPLTRNAERTRRALLDAARRAIRERGTNVALGTVADMAGVTKGGLLHHFPSRDALFVAVARDALDEFRARVFALVDLSENHPGKLVRAYTRALFDTDDVDRDRLDVPGLWCTLSVVPEVPRMLQEDADYWRASLAEDGLHPDRILLAQHAAEGIVNGMTWDTALTPELAAHARSVILELTNRNGPLDGA